MKKSFPKKYKVAAAITFISASIIIFFQNCSEVDFQTNEDLVSFTCRTEGCFDGMINPDVDVERPPLKVALVVDNSNSMEPAQIFLSEGVKSLIDDLKGFQAEYRVFTTTQYGAKQVAKESSFCIETLADGTPPKEYATCPTTKKEGATYESGTRVSLAPSLTAGAEFSIAEDASESDFITLKTKLGDAIKSVGTSGNDTEQGICTLNRMVYEAGTNKIFDVGDTAIFALISDEEDKSTGTSCLSGLNRKVEQCTGYLPSTLKRSVNYEVKLLEKSTTPRVVSFNWRKKSLSRDLTYKTQSWKQFINYKFQPAPIDGTPQPINEQYWTTPRERNINNSCSTTKVTCDASALAQVKSWSGYDAIACEMSCAATPTLSADQRTTKTLDISQAANYCGAMNETTCTQLLGTVAGYAAGTCTGQARPSGYPLSAADPALLTGCYRKPENETKTITATITAPNVCSNVKTAADDNAVNNFLNSNGGELVPGTSVSVSCGTTTTLPEEFKTISITQTVANETEDPANLCATNFAAVKTEAQSKNPGRTVADGYCTRGAVGALQYIVDGKSYAADPKLPNCTVTEAAAHYGFPLNVKSASTVDLKQSFAARANSLFGKKYLVSALIHDRVGNPACPIINGQSQGLGYMQLINLITGLTGFPGVIDSICTPDYGVALAPAATWAKDIIGNTYVASGVDTSKGQAILNVWLVRGGVKITLTADQVSFAGATVTFADGVLQKGDEIHFRATAGK